MLELIGFLAVCYLAYEVFEIRQANNKPTGATYRDKPDQD